MDHGLCPSEWHGAGVVTVDEGIDVTPELVNVGEACAGEGVTLENGEPDLDLVEPGAVGRREVEADVGMTGQPAITLGLVGRQVVEDDVDFLAAIVGDDAVHEVEELDAPTPLAVPARHWASGHFDGGKHRRRAVALVVIAAPAECPPGGQLEITLSPLQRLDMRLL